MSCCIDLTEDDKRIVKVHQQPIDFKRIIEMVDSKIHTHANYKIWYNLLNDPQQAPRLITSTMHLGSTKSTQLLIYMLDLLSKLTSRQ